ncbi:putative transmembrane channel-like protein 5 [Scophthalmus maximus]|uniref:Putative transmembrane channel-like protein 5 n=1 Tax=Scophthalmus maximus TaxID=52904 RepID=A0A2U9BPT3_SCOMX|nr:putative transmembrane channel-like protein 5 [Scophthalmus maximus]
MQKCELLTGPRLSGQVGRVQSVVSSYSIPKWEASFTSRKANVEVLTNLSSLRTFKEDCLTDSLFCDSSKIYSGATRKTRYSSKSNHTNPYAREDPTWRGDRAETHNRSAGQTTGGDDAMARVSWRGWQGESWRGIESIPMGLISTRPGSPSWRHDLSEWRIYL